MALSILQYRSRLKMWSIFTCSTKIWNPKELRCCTESNLIFKTSFIYDTKIFVRRFCSISSKYQISTPDAIPKNVSYSVSSVILLIIFYL